MKKTLKLFGLAALAAIAFSCTKNDDLVTPPTTPTDETVPGGEPAAPSVVPATDGGVLTSFGVTFEGQQDADTKVSINIGDGTTAIENGDEVLVYVSETNNATYKYNKGKFELSEGAPVTLDAPASVFYPADEYVVEGSNVKLKMPGAIEASDDFGAINPMAGVITETDGNYNVELKNLISVLRVKVTADVNITSVLLNFGITSKYAEGAKFIVNAAESTLAFSDASGASGTTVTLATPADSADVLFLLPTVALPNGLEIMANLAENHNGGMPIYTIVNSSTDAPARNTISTMSFYAGLFSGGAGTEQNPYKITKARDFKYISKYCKEGYGSKNAASFLGAHYQQTANISFGKDAEHKVDLSEYMIGVQTTLDVRFSGVYDGQNYKLQNFSLSGKAVNTGLWKAAYNAKLMNIHVDNAEVTSTAGYVGAIVANQAGDECLLHNCKATNTTVSGTEKVGGICGRSRGKVSNCTFGADGQTVSVSGTTEVGGILGNHSGSRDVSECVNYGSVNCSNVRGGGIIGVVNNVSINVSDCTNHGTVGNAKNYKGGVIGSYYSQTENSTLTITNAVNHGTVRGQSGVGGIIGGTDNADGQVNVNMVIDGTTLNDGNVTGTNNNVGGIIGYPFNTTLTIGGTTCTNKANVTGNQYVGGIVGQIAVDGTISSCTNSGAVEAKVTNANACVGGIVGMVNETEGISSCTNTGDVTAKKPHIGGIIGLLKAGTVDRCMNTAKVYGDITNSSNVGGIVGCIEGGGVGVIKRCYNSKSSECRGANRVGGIVGNINYAGSQVVNCATYGRVIGAGEATENNNLCAGAIVGQCSTIALVANCLVRDHTQMVVATHISSTNKYLMGYLVGYVAGGATFQNCFIAGVSHHIQDKTTHAGSGGTVNANSSYSGQALSAGNRNTKSLTCGKAVDAAFFKDIYVRGNSNCGGVWKPNGNNSTCNNVKWVSTAYNTNYTWNSYVQSQVTLSDGTTTFAAKTKYPHEILTAGSLLITGYTASDGESMEWSGVTAGSRLNYPVPTALVELFDGKVSED